MTSLVAVLVASLGALVSILSLARLRARPASVGFVVVAVCAVGGDFTQAPSSAVALAGLGVGVPLLAAGLASDWPIVKNMPVAGWVFLPSAVALAMVVVNTALVLQTPVLDSLQRFLPALLWLLASAAVAARVVNFDDIANAVFLSFGLACAFVMVSPTPWTPCTQFKCGPAGMLLSGPFSSENLFARLAGAAIVLTIAVEFRRTQRAALAITTLSLGAAVVYFTESRTTQIAIVAALAIALPVVRGRIGRWSSWLIPTGAAGVSLVLIYTAQPTDFSNRGGIWRMGTRYMGEGWFSGVGIDSWSSQVLERNFMHSQTLLLLFGGGALALVLHTWLLGAASAAAARTPGRRLTIIGYIATLSMLEVTWNPVAFDGTAIFLLLILCSFAVPARSLSKSMREVRHQ